MSYYSTPAAVIRDSGIKPGDLGYQDINGGDTKEERLRILVPVLGSLALHCE